MEFFFSKSCLKVGGVAYTRVWLIHESLRYVHVLLSAGCAIYKIIYLTRLKLGTICDNCIHTKWRIPPDVNNRAHKLPTITINVIIPLKNNRRNNITNTCTIGCTALSAKKATNWRPNSLALGPPNLSPFHYLPKSTTCPKTQYLHPKVASSRYSVSQGVAQKTVCEKMKKAWREEAKEHLWANLTKGHSAHLLKGLWPPPHPTCISHLRQ